MDGTAIGTGIGQPVRRREDLRLLTGRGRYSDDVNLPGQAYAVMVRSPHAHAWVRGIDTAKARAMPGVLAVLTTEDVKADGLNPLPHIAHTHPADISIQNRDGAPVLRPQHRAIGEPRICRAGGHGACGRAGGLGVPPEQARVVMQDVGGNFGTRGSFNAEFALVAWAAKRLGRPVKWTSDRQEYFVADHQARDLAVTAELALDREGQFLAMRGSNLVNQGAYALAFGPLNKGVEIMSSIYHVPAVHFRGRAALTNTIPTRPYRSSGRPEVMFVMERLIDLAALETSIDRIELRRRNLVPESMMPYTNPFGMVYDSGAYHRVMERVLEIADWAGFPARREASRRHGKYRGIGVANYVDTATGAPREKAEVTVKPEGRVDGTVEVVIGTTSQGQGHETSFAQLITEWLGVPLDPGKPVTGDTGRG